jgi:protein tyrosine phosphatase (PTP) superfamily phosphohydrolase (DUF442 family)
MLQGLRTTCRAAALGLVLGLAGALTAEVGWAVSSNNWHSVIPGRAYRSAQLSPAQLANRVRRYGIRTVINLRGLSPTLDWYMDESRATHALDLAQEDVTFSAYRLPSPDELRRLVEVFDQTEYPVLIHCRQGVDRTGLASAVLMLLHTDAPLAEARRQLSLRYGHVPLGPTKALGEFFDLYDEWLRGRGVAHSPAVMREWVATGYCPGYCRGRIELLAHPAAVRVGEPAVVRVRAHNTSVRPWELKPGTETGVHVRFLVFDPGWKLSQIGRAGQFEANVPPGGSIDLTLALTPPTVPGSYFVQTDLLDGNRCSFIQLGSEPLELNFQVIE